MLEDYPDISFPEDRVEFSRLLVGGNDGSVVESVPRFDVVKIEVLL